jgi:hypothetical protein
MPVAQEHNYDLTINNPPPPVITSCHSNGTSRSGILYTITATNSPTSFNAAGLPPV